MFSMLPDTSLTGSAAALCIERGVDPDAEGTARLYRHGKRGSTPPKRLQAPLPGEGVPQGICRRCGLVGEHRDAAACIDALRSMVADLQLKHSHER